jgi:hypothetical protein
MGSYNIVKVLRFAKWMLHTWDTEETFFLKEEKWRKQEK